MAEPATLEHSRAAPGAAARYAVYFAPALDSPWSHFGRRWLQGAWLRPHIESSAWPAMLQDPRRYGFHATLKAPFRLAPGGSRDMLVQRLGRLAGQLRGVALGPIEVKALVGYVALVPMAAPPALQALADRCVIDLDDLRAPTLPADLARRQPHRLDDRGRALLQAYGYPHVLERFRFHMTLAMTASAADAERVLACARGPVAALQSATPLVVDRLCLCVEPAMGQPFERLQDFVLGR
jgi:hypothetical protein